MCRMDGFKMMVPQDENQGEQDEPEVSRESGENDSDDGGDCGWLCCLPKPLQFFNTPKWFLVFLCLCVLFQSTAINGLNGVVIPTIEQRFRLTSQSSGLIPGSYEIAAAVLVLPVSYFGERAHKPRWLGIGCVLIGIGALLFALPQFITGQYQSENLVRLESCAVDINHTSHLSICEKDSPGIYGLLIVGQLVIGIGAVGLYTVGVSFLDEIATPQYVHFYIGIFYVVAAAGAAIGFLLGSLFLAQYVDTGVSDYPSASDPNFVGRWWAGYVVVGFAALVVSVPLLMYPRRLPNTAHIMKAKMEKQKGTGRSAKTSGAGYGRAEADTGTPLSAVGRLRGALREFVVLIRLVFELLFTPVLLFNTLGGTTEGFAVAGLVPFITKYFETQFSVTSSAAGLLTGVASFLGLVGGIFTSSWLLKYRNVHGPRLAKYTAVIALISTVFITAFLVRCPRPPIVGATRPYFGSTITGSNRCKTVLNDTCFSSCGCVSERYDPVCGSDGFTYPTPCLAGCQDFRNGSTDSEDDRTYTRCSCVAANLASDGNLSLALPNATATVGVCTDSDCALLPLFMILLILGLFFTFMNNVPAIEVILQSVPADRRTMATGVQWVIIRLLATIPGPVFYGFLLDKGCRLWQLTCCDEGNCWEYDGNHMSYSLFGASFALKIMSFIFFFLSWRFFKADHAKSSASDPESVSSEQDAGGKVVESEATGGMY